MQQHRRQMTQDLLEAMMFSKVTNRFWNAETVSHANQDSISERSKNRMKEHENYFVLFLHSKSKNAEMK